MPKYNDFDLDVQNGKEEALAVPKTFRTTRTMNDEMSLCYCPTRPYTHDIQCISDTLL